MIAYFDASAVLKLVIAEPGSADARAVWDDAHTRASAERIGDATAVFVAADGHLLAAAAQRGLNTLPLLG